MRTTTLCILAVCAALLTGRAATQATATALPAPSMVAQLSVPGNDAYDLAGGLGSVWLLNPDESQYSTLRRIDPVTNRVTASYQLDSSAGGFAVGDGSIWVAMYFDNTVERLDAHGHVLAHIAVGLQPQWIYLAFGSVWVSNHHGRSVTRIDPRTNRIVATLPAGDQHMFRDGPQAMTDDGRYLYLYSSNGTEPFERIDPRTDAVTTRAAPVNCGDIVAITGSVWTTDCTDTITLKQLDPATGATRHTITPTAAPVPPSMTALRHALWVAFDTSYDGQTGAASGGTVEELNPPTGVVQQQLAVGGDASVIRHAAGDLWVLDQTNGVITRLHPGRRT